MRTSLKSISPSSRRSRRTTTSKTRSRKGLPVRAGLRRRHVARTVAFDADVHLGPQDLHVPDGNLAPPERVDAKTDFQAIGVEERRRARRLPAVNGQLAERHAQAQGIEVELLQLDGAAGDPFDSGRRWRAAGSRQPRRSR